MSKLLQELIGGRKSRKVHHSSKTHFKKHGKTRRNKNTRKKHAGFLKDFFNNATKAATEAATQATKVATKAVGTAKNTVMGSVPPPKEFPPSRVEDKHVKEAIGNASEVTAVGGKFKKSRKRKNSRKRPGGFLFNKRVQADPSPEQQRELERRQREQEEKEANEIHAQKQDIDNYMREFDPNMGGRKKSKKSKRKRKSRKLRKSNKNR